MKNQSSENYLDQLLNSINDDDLGLDISPMKEEPQMDEFERELFGEPETKEMLTAKDEEDFLREFEAELLRDDIPNFSDDFMRDMEPDISMDGTVDASIDDMISHMDAFEDVPVAEEEPPVDEDADFSGEIPGEPEVLTEEEEEAARADENLEQAVHMIRPYAVDLSSSVETDGHKDPDKIAKAVQTVRNIKEDF